MTLTQQPNDENKTPVTCELCGEPMPPGEQMFKFHGYSGPCPKPKLGQPPYSPTMIYFHADAIAFRTERDAALARAEKAEALTADAKKSRDWWQTECRLNMHRVITCGVAAGNPEAASKGAYAEQWNTVQADDVRRLRAKCESAEARVKWLEEEVERVKVERNIAQCQAGTMREDRE